MTGMYANIIVDISHEKVDRPFQYKIPERLQGKLEPGMCVRVPFGAGNKPLTGYIIEITDKVEFDPARIKEISELVTGKISIEAKQIALAAWIKKQYGSTMIQALKTVLPSKQSVKSLENRKVILLLSPEEGRAVLGEFIRKHQTARVRLFEELLTNTELPYGLVTRKLNISASVLKPMVEKGYIKIETDRVFRNPVKEPVKEKAKVALSQEQLQIVTKVLTDYDQGNRGTYLIHGITGSGKTEVYIEMILEMQKRGKQAIVLIPEIALTYQTVMRFYAHFGNRVSVMNSTLSQGEKYDQCERAKHGEIDVIIGPRSALFVPFPDLGLIIIDEEHENSYKSESNPKYHARETAEKLADMYGASLVLGSATPSLESYYRTQTGQYYKFELNKRLTGGTLPAVYTIDLREELKQGNRSIFSQKLQELLSERLEKKEQSMLFLNRRGYAGFISCRACGHVMKCPHCDVSLSEHNHRTLVCHYCGYTTNSVTTCPECGSKYISGFRAGTQQIEEKLKQIFPQARVLRMDADTTKNKDSYEEILSAFANEEADILVGTQMIVKGHDFPNVTLVGILAADLSLSVGDYRASERTFQLLTQAAGRAGRGKKPGEVVIQTYQPEHYSIVHAANQDYKSFYEEEILYREMLRYPPVSNMLAVLVMAKEETKGWELAQKLSGMAKVHIVDSEPVSVRLLVIGPAPASIGKMNDIFRFVFYVKHQEYEKLIQIKDELEEKINELQLRNEMVQFDFNPMNMY